MKKTITQLTALLFTLLCVTTTKAQLNYLPGGFIATTSTYVDLGTNGVPIITPNNDDAFSAPQPIGFTFMFNGHPYDSFVLSTNGFIKLGRDSASRHFLFTTHAQPPANGVFPLNGTTSPTPLASDSSMLFAFGQNLVAHPSVQPYSVYTDGTFGQRVCTIQWKNVKDTLQAGAAGLWDTINFQIKLYESTNVIEYVYGKWTSTVSNPIARFAAVGIVGNSVTVANQNIHLVKGSTVAWSGTVAVTGFYVNNAVNYRNPTSTPAGPAPVNGTVFSFTPIVANDANVRVIYAQGKVALPFYTPDSIRANISNPGTNAITGLTVTLDILGANVHTATAFIASLAPGANTNVAFPPYMPTNLGNCLIRVSVPNDDNNANNEATYGMSVSNSALAYTDTTKGISGSNGTTLPNFWGARYFVNGSALATQVKFFLVANSEALGDTLRGIIMDSTGLILGTSPIRIVQPSDLGATITFNITNPPSVTNRTIIAGVAGGTSVDGLNYFLGTSQTETPFRPNSPFYFMTQALAGGVTNANVGSIYSTPISWSTTRLMMECSVVPIPQVDVNVSATIPINNFKIPANTAIPLRAIVRNTGLQTRPSGIPVFYKVGSSPAVGPVVTGGTIDPGDTASVLFSGTNALNFGTPGNYEVKVYTALVGDSLPGNDTIRINYTVTPAVTLPYVISSDILNTWSIVNPTTFSSPMWVNNSVTKADGTFGTNVLTANNQNITTGTKGRVMSPIFNFTGIANPNLRFNIAHGPNTNTSLNDSLEVLVSTDQGYTFTSVWAKSSSNSTPRLGTDTATAFSYFPNFSTDWRYETVDLTAFAGSPRVVIAFQNTSAGGNSIFINDVTVSNPSAVSIQPVFSTGAYVADNLVLTFTSIGAANSDVVFSTYTTPSFSNASPVIATNTTATTNNSSVFTPTNTSLNKWHAITYSGVATGNFPQTVAYTLSYSTTTANGITSADSVYLLRRANASSSWQAINTTQSSGNFNSGILTGFYDYTIGSVSGVNPLPVKWLQVSATYVDDRMHRIQWSTASELNTDYFVIEQSTDLVHFDEVGTVKAAGNSTTERSYSFNNSSSNGFGQIVYYRIKQVDLDGDFSYSIVVDVKKLQLPNDWNVVNPITQKPEIVYNNTTGVSKITIEIWDVTGKNVANELVYVSNGTNKIVVNTNDNLTKGVYFIRISSANEPNPLTRKVIKL